MTSVGVLLIWPLGGLLKSSITKVVSRKGIFFVTCILLLQLIIFKAASTS